MNELTPLQAFNNIDVDTKNNYVDEFIIIQKALKALEIIKEKGNFLCLDYSEYENKYYIYDAELYIHNELTKEEYDLLKEVLEQ